MGAEPWQVGVLPRRMPNFYAGRSGKDPDCVRQCAHTAGIHQRRHITRIVSGPAIVRSPRATTVSPGHDNVAPPVAGPPEMPRARLGTEQRVSQW